MYEGHEYSVFLTLNLVLERRCRIASGEPTILETILNNNAVCSSVWIYYILPSYTVYHFSLGLLFRNRKSFYCGSRYTASHCVHARVEMHSTAITRLRDWRLAVL